MYKEIIYEKRIEKNEKEIEKLEEKKKRIKLVRNGFAVAALITTALGTFIYKTAPAEGAIFYVSGGNDTEIEYSNYNFESEDDLFPTKNGRNITKDGIKKTYYTKAETKDGYRHIKVSLPQIVSKVDTNSLITKEINIKDAKIYVRTVPNSDSTLASAILATSGVFTGIGDIFISTEKLYKYENEETELNRKNRTLKRKIK